MSVATPRVVVVSESRITRRVVEMTFADQPLQLAVFAAGQDAIDDWQTRPPALLIADIAMHATNGYALARELRAHRRRPEVGGAAAGRSGRCRGRRGGGRGSGLGGAAQAARLPSAHRRGAAGPEDRTASAGDVAAGGASRPGRRRPWPAARSPWPSPSRSAPNPPRRRPARPSRGRRRRAAARPGVGARRDTTAGAWVEDTAAADGLADTFHALLEVEQGIRPAAAPAASLSEAEVDRIALHVAAVVATDAALAARLEAAIVERVAPARSIVAAERAASGWLPTSSPRSSTAWSASWRRRLPRPWRTSRCATKSPGCAAHARRLTVRPGCAGR